MEEELMVNMKMEKIKRGDFENGIDPFETNFTKNGDGVIIYNSKKYGYDRRIKMKKCMELAATLPNKSVSELIDNAKKIHTFLNSSNGY